MVSTHRLRQIRHLDGLNIAKAAEQFGVASSTYGAIERGSRAFTLDAARIGYSKERLCSLPQLSEPLHRQRASVGEKIIQSNKEQLRLAGELLLELRDREPKCPIVTIRRLESPRSHADIDAAAAEVRYMLGVGEDEPILNLTSAVERAGVCLTPVYDDPIRVSKSPKRVDGLSAWVDHTAQPVIGINPESSGDRFRLTLAHELGHLVMHRSPTECTEDEAFLFASVLLVPTEQFDELIPNRPMMRHFEALKRTWGVSIAAGVYRAHELGKLDDDRYRSLQMQMAKWRHREPGEFEPRLGRLLDRLIEHQGGPAIVASELGIAEDHIRRAISWTPRAKLHSLPGGSDMSDDSKDLNIGNENTVHLFSV